MADVGKNIRKIRKEKNLTQDQMAERMHVTRQTISNYENGRSQPSIDVLIEIAKTLDVGVDALIYGSEKSGSAEGIVRRRFITYVIILLAGILLEIMKAKLTPAAKRYQDETFLLYPTLLLQFVVHPVALAFLGFGATALIREAFVLRQWKLTTLEIKLVNTLKTVMEKRITCVMVKGVHYASFAVFFLLTAFSLWKALDWLHEWYWLEKTRQLSQTLQISFDSEETLRGVTPLMPKALRRVFEYMNMYVRRSGATKARTGALYAGVGVVSGLFHKKYTIMEGGQDGIHEGL